METVLSEYIKLVKEWERINEEEKIRKETARKNRLLTFSKELRNFIISMIINLDFKNPGLGKKILEASKTTTSKIAFDNGYFGFFKTIKTPYEFISSQLASNHFFSKQPYVFTISDYFTYINGFRDRAHLDNIISKIFYSFHRMMDIEDFDICEHVKSYNKRW